MKAVMYLILSGRAEYPMYWYAWFMLVSVLLWIAYTFFITRVPRGTRATRRARW
jgi:hypothetical protein